MVTDGMDKGRRDRLFLWGLLLVALGLRLVRLDFQPLWWDEGWSLYFATADVRAILELTAVDIHPPLYYLLLHVWIRTFGPSVVSVRLLSVLIGTSTVALFFVAFRRLLGHRPALFAALLLAISPFHVYYSQEVRMYGLVALLGLVASHLAIQWEPGKPGKGIWLGYVLAATAALYAQYYSAFLLLALNLIVLIRWLRGRPSLRKLMPWLGAQAATLLLFLPWLWYAGGKLLTYVRFKVGVEQDPSQGLLVYLSRHLAAFNWGHAEGLLSTWWWIGLLPLAILLLTLAATRWPRFSQAIEKSSTAVDRAPLFPTGRWPSVILHPAFLIVAVILSCGFIVNLAFPFNPPRGERLLLLALPAYLLWAATALLALRRYGRSLAAVAAASFLLVALVSMVFFYTVPRYPEDDYRPVVDRVRTLGLPGDVVLAVHPWQIGYFQAYIPDDKARPTLVLTPREVVPRERQLWVDEPARMAADLDNLLAQHGRLWFLDHRTMGRVLEEEIEAYLVEHAYPVLSEWHGENTVLSFFAEGYPVAQPTTAGFADWLTLEGTALSQDPVDAGWGIAAVDLLWQVSEPPADEYTVGLRLVGPTGQVWAQRDAPPRGGLAHFSEWPAGEPQIDRHGLLIPAGTPPGEYQVGLRVYHSRDLDVLPVTFSGGSGGEIVLGTVRVVRPKTSPPAAALPIERPFQVDFGQWLRLLGYTQYSSSVLLPGEPAMVELFWQALVDPGQDFLPRLVLLDAQDRVLAEWIEKPVAGTYPTAWWHAGELVRDPHALPIPAAVPPGVYRLALSLVRAADGQPVETERGHTVVDLIDIEVQGRERRYQPTSPQHVQVVPLASVAELTGYDLEQATSTPGSSLEVTLHWHALQTPDRNYHSFVHLLDTDDTIVTQHDGPPAKGNLPMMGWLPGEYLTDTHRLEIPSSLADGEYRLGVGIYDPDTSVRLGERVILNTTVQIGAAEE